MVVAAIVPWGQSRAQTASADGTPEWSALLESGIANPGGAFGSVTFPDSGSVSYTATFQNVWLSTWPLQVAQGWTGTVSMDVTGSAQPQESSFQVSGSRLTEGNDFNVGGVSNNSGNFYEMVGRGLTAFNNGGSGSVSTWTVTFDFAGLDGGYLPSGTLLSFIDIGDGLNETMSLSANLHGGGTGFWMSEIDFSTGQGGRDQQTPAYRGGGVYDIGLPPEGPVFASGGAEYVLMTTVADLSTLQIVATQGPGGGSYGFKIAAPLSSVPEPGAPSLFLPAALLCLLGRRRP